MPDSIRDLIQRYGAARSATIALVGLLTLVAIYGLSRWATAPVWVPVATGMSLDDVAVVTAALDESGMKYRLDAGGAQVRVAQEDLARARVLLAQAGATPSRGEPGFELFDRPSWGMTDFTQRINYRRALEGELERTIGRMQGVEAAQVHLAMNESSAFRSAQQETTASVVLTLRSGARPSSELVEGITSLVASSVGHLASDHVSVLDHQGRLLSGSVESGGSAGARRQLAMRREVETYLEAKAEDLVAQVVGAGNARIRVAADVSFDRIDRTVQKVNPDDQIATREERTDITPADGQIAAASRAIAAEYETSRTIETFSGAIGDVRRLTVAVLVNERAGADGAVLPPETVRQIEALVAHAVGLNAGRGDAISVLSVPFGGATVIPPAAPAAPVIERVQPLLKPIIALIAILIAAFVALRALATLRADGRRAPIAAPAALKPAEAASGIDMPRRAVLPRAPQIEDPQMTARVIRAWIRE